MISEIYVHGIGAVSRLCLGTAPMGDDDTRDFAILDAYYDMGGRFLDTANVYGRWGRHKNNASERTLGRWLKARGCSDVTITSKCCHYMPEAREISRVNEECAFTDLEESRSSLGMDTIPIYLLHRDNTAVDMRTITDFCVKMVDSGKVRRFGFSNFTADRVRAAVDYLGKNVSDYLAGVSNEWSLAMEGADGYNPPDGMVAVDPALTSLCAERELAIFPFSAAAHGFFAKLEKCGAVTENGKFVSTDGFTGNKSWLTDKNAAHYDKLRAASAETGISVGMLSVAYLINKPQPVIPIVSVSKISQLEEWSAVCSMKHGAIIK